MRRMFCLLLLNIGAVALTGCVSGPQSTPTPTNRTLRLASLIWPPFTSPDLPNGGPATEIVVSALRKAGYDATVHYLPWQEALTQTMAGVYDGIYPAYFSEERFEKGLFSEPFMSSPVMLCARRDKHISYHSLESLKAYRIGVVAGYVNSEEFDSAADLNKIIGSSDYENLVNLARGKLDLVVVDRIVGAAIISKNLQSIGPLTDFEFLEPHLEMRDSYLMLPRCLESSVQRQQDFDEIIRSMRDKKRIERILQRHGFQ